MFITRLTMNVNFKDFFVDFAVNKQLSFSNNKLSQMLPRMSKSLLLIMLSGVLSPVAVIARDDSDKVSYA